LRRFTEKEREKFLSNIGKMQEHLNKKAKIAEGLLSDEENDIAINEEETLGYWTNRLLLLTVIFCTYTAGIKFVNWPSYSTILTYV